MTKNRLSELAAVTVAVYQREYRQLRPLLQQEAGLRAQLARLDLQVAEVRSEGAKADGYNVTGGDMLWHSWESATRRNLNIELARARAQKLAALDNLRTAFGRKQAVETLVKQRSKKRGT